MPAVFYNGSRSQRRRGAELRNIRDDLKRSGGQIAEKPDFMLLLTSCFIHRFFITRSPSKFTFNQWFCIIDADILSIMVIPDHSIKIAKMAFIQRRIVQQTLASSLFLTEVKPEG